MKRAVFDHRLSGRPHSLTLRTCAARQALPSGARREPPRAPRLLTLVLLAAGCTTGMAGWDGGWVRPMELPAEVASSERGADPSANATASPAEFVPLAAARGVSEQESSGPGLLAYVQYTGFGGLRSNAYQPSNVNYSHLYDPGIGFGASLIVRRPPSGTLALGDIFALASFELQTLAYSGRAAGGYSGFDDMTIMSFWLDAKTMLRPLGGSGVLKPYVLLGAGLAFIPEVEESAGVFYDTSIVPALRAKLGIELRGGKLGLFADIGVQMLGAPSVGPAITEGDGDAMFLTPLRAGAVVNF